MINQGQIDKDSYELESASDFFPDPESDLTIVSVLSDFESDCSSIDFSDVESDCGSDSSWGSSFESIAISDLDYNDECETNSEFEDEKETDLDLTIVTQMEFEDSFSVMGSRLSSFREEFDYLSEVEIEDELRSRIGDDRRRQYVVDEMDESKRKFELKQKSAQQRHKMVAQAVVGFFRSAWIKSRRAFKLEL
ncbi:uncharacterized protein LOC135696491 [Rhopilema esculentum]|uniref:uncharacterized protein LOC135696491 n=1 Tax=Rhopilema esculentum TaxID=499914 RepID=UPI0031D92AB4